MRTFIAFDITAETRAALRAVQKSLSKLNAVRWTNPASVHLTMKFIGDVPDSHLPDVLAAMRHCVAGVPPLDVNVRGLGCFPSPARPRILWAGVEGSVDPLRQISSCLNTTLADLGVPPDNKGFRPHVTVGRVRGRVDSDALDAALGQFARHDFGQNTLSELVLYMSELAPSGARYTKMGAVPLETEAKEDI